MSEMFKYKQVIREDGVEVITIIHKGVHTFNPTSLVFPYIKECIEANKALYPVEDLISHKVITPSKMEIKNHRFTILDEVIDDKLIYEHSDKLELLQHLFLNLKNHGYDKSKTIGLFVNKAKEIKPMTDDGFVFLIAEKGDYKNTPVFYSNQAEHVAKCFSNLKLGKKLRQVLLDKMLKEDEVNPCPLFIVKEFSKTWDENQLRDLLELDLSYSQEKSIERLYSFYEFYFNTPKSFLNILKKETVTSAFLDKFSIMKKFLSQEVKVTSISKLEEFIEKSYKNYKTQLDWEKLCVKHPLMVKTLDSEVCGYTLKSPKDSGEVVSWGNTMGNCYGGRANNYIEGKLCLFGLFNSEDKLTYVFEVVYKEPLKGHFGDFEGKRRVAPPRELVQALAQLFKEKADFSVRER